VAKEVYFDASGLVKRYVPENGSAVVNYLFQHTSPVRFICLALGILEVISILVRKKNANLIPLALYQQTLLNFRNEVINAAAVKKISAADPVVYAAASLVEKHSINGTDGVLLRSALDLAAQLRLAGDDLLLVAADQRLLRAAQAEGLATFNPEVQTQAELDVLLGP
jgi:predicted nucleic acid-binding protein